MADLTPSDLRDPQPPVPGERERALVAARAHELGRRRRLAQGGGALALVAAVAVSVAALTAGGSSGPGGTNRVEAAASGADTTVTAPVSHITTLPPTTVAPAPAPDTTPAPEPTPDTTPAPVAQEVPTAPAVAPQEVPSTFTLSGTVTGNPSGTTVTLTITGPGGSFEVAVDGGGNFSLSGLAPGDYAVVGQWTDSTGTATRAERFGTVPVTGDSSVSFTFSQ